MIVDTNVILRALDPAGGPQSDAARRRIADAREQGARLKVLSATVLELGFVLSSPRAGYDMSRAAVAEALSVVCAEAAFDVEHCAALERAAAAYGETRSVALHDCFLHALAEERDTRVLSFDRDLRRLGTGEAP